MNFFRSPTPPRTGASATSIQPADPEKSIGVDVRIIRWVKWHAVGREERVWTSGRAERSVLACNGVGRAQAQELTDRTTD